MNKRQRKKQFKTLWHESKAVSAGYATDSLEEPLEKFMDSETATFTDLGSCFERIKDGLQKSVSALGSCESFYFWVEQIEKELKKRR